MRETFTVGMHVRHEGKTWEIVKTWKDYLGRTATLIELPDGTRANVMAIWLLPVYVDLTPSEVYEELEYQRAGI